MAAGNPLYPAAPASSTGYVSDFDLQAAELARRRRYAEMLRQQAMSAPPPPRNAPVSWAQPIAQAFLGYNARAIDEEAAAKERELEQKRSEEISRLWREDRPRDSAPVIGGAGAEQTGGPGGAAGMELPTERATSAGRKATDEDWLDFAEKVGRTGGRYGQNLGEIISKRAIANILPKDASDIKWERGPVVEGPGGKSYQQYYNKEKPQQTYTDTTVPVFHQPTAYQQVYDGAMQILNTDPKYKTLSDDQKKIIANDRASKSTQVNPQGGTTNVLSGGADAYGFTMPSDAGAAGTQPTPATTPTPAAVAPTPAAAAPTPTMVSGAQAQPQGMVPKLPDFGMPEEDRPPLLPTAQGQAPTPMVPNIASFNFRDMPVSDAKAMVDRAMIADPNNTELRGYGAGGPVGAPPHALTQAPRGAPQPAPVQPIGAAPAAAPAAPAVAAAAPPVTAPTTAAPAAEKSVTVMNNAELWKKYGDNAQNRPYLIAPPTRTYAPNPNDPAPAERMNAEIKDIKVMRDKHKLGTLETALQQFDQTMGELQKSGVPIYRDKKTGEWRGANPGMGWESLNPIPNVAQQFMQQAKGAIDNIEILIRSGQAVTGTELPRVLKELGSAINQGPEVFWKAIENVRQQLRNANNDILNAHAPIVRDFWNASQFTTLPNGVRIRPTGR